MRAFIFPGQGSQAVGMGAALAEASRAAPRRVRRGRRGARPEPVPADARGPGRRAQAHRKCAAGDHGAFDRGVRATMGRSISRMSASFVAGHSLGEYSALCAAGSFDLATTAKLLKLRGQAMQQAVPVGRGRNGGAARRRPRAGAEDRRSRGARARSAPSPTTMTRPGRDLRPQGGDRPGDRDGEGHGRQARGAAAGVGAVPLPADAARGRGDARCARLCRRRGAGGAGLRQRHRAAGDRPRHDPQPARRAGYRHGPLARERRQHGRCRRRTSSSRSAARCSARWSSASRPTRRSPAW